jgi:transposase
MPLIGLPPYSPELNPAERVFEEVRREIESEVYATLDEKVMAVQKFLTDLESDPERMRSLTRRDWIETAVQGLPVNYAA